MPRELEITPPMRILLIEDDVDLAASAYDYLEADGFVMDSALDGVTGLHLANTHAYEAIVLDLRLPGIGGIDLCRKLRGEGGCQAPIIMVTARDTLDDKLSGFGAGADDYMVKPFSLQELAVRLRALGRRGQLQPCARYQVADLSLDKAMHEVRRGGGRIDLTPATMRLLELLMQRSPAVVGHAELERMLWGDDVPDSTALRTHIYALRAAIDRPFARKLLHTVHSVGYRLLDTDGDVD